MELCHVTVQQVFEAVDKLNSRPSKCLGYKTSYKSFELRAGFDIRLITGYALMTCIRFVIVIAICNKIL